MLRRLLLASLPLLAVRPAHGADLWRRLQDGGLVVLMRHAATVPGIGDPPGFALATCSTQRNLSEAGRDDAARIGAAFRRRRAPVGAVMASRWCRCLDTARLAFDRVQPEPMLDSMFNDDSATRERKLSALRRYLARWQGPGNLVLITHDVNIRALTGDYLAQGDMVVAQAQTDGTLKVLGRLLPG